MEPDGALYLRETRCRSLNPQGERQAALLYYPEESWYPQCTLCCTLHTMSLWIRLVHLPLFTATKYSLPLSLQTFEIVLRHAVWPSTIAFQILMSVWVSRGSWRQPWMKRTWCWRWWWWCGRGCGSELVANLLQLVSKQSVRWNSLSEFVWA